MWKARGQSRHASRALRVRIPATLPSSVVCEGRYPGSRVLICRLPRLFAQWPIDSPTLAYRCGGSTGMLLRVVQRKQAPVSRLTAAANLRGGTLHDPFSHLRPAKMPIIACPQGALSTTEPESACHITNKVQKRCLCLDQACFLNL
mgnify:CR=1 FL=1